MIEIEDPTDILKMYNTPLTTANGFRTLADELFNGDLKATLMWCLEEAKKTKDPDHVRVAYGAYLYWYFNNK